MEQAENRSIIGIPHMARIFFSVLTAASVSLVYLRVRNFLRVLNFANIAEGRLK